MLNVARGALKRMLRSKGDVEGLMGNTKALKGDGGIIVLLYLYTCQSRDFPVYFIQMVTDVLCHLLVRKWMIRVTIVLTFGITFSKK